MTTGAPPPRADWRVWTGLAVLALPTLLVSGDISILFLALPRLSENAQQTFTSAMNVVAVIVAILAALLAIVAATTLRDAERPGEGAPAEGAGESAQVAPVES